MSAGLHESDRVAFCVICELFCGTCRFKNSYGSEKTVFEPSSNPLCQSTDRALYPTFLKVFPKKGMHVFGWS